MIWHLGITILIVLATVVYMIVHALLQLVSVPFLDPPSSLLYLKISNFFCILVALKLEYMVARGLLTRQI